MERKSPLPAFTKCVKNNVLPLREDRNLGFRGGVKNKPINSSTIHPLNITFPSPACGTLPRGVVVEPFTPHHSRFTSKKVAFTLAEVLITLGIIGIVAAMTMPALIQKNNNKVVETRLKKFYSAINQAVLMAEKDYGDKKVWYEDLAGADVDEEGNIIEGSSEAEVWFRKYLAPYMKITKMETLSDGSFVAYFADGGALRMRLTDSTRDWDYFPGNVNKCLSKNSRSSYIRESTGKCAFTFIFNPAVNSEGWKYHYNKGFEPYKVTWDGNIETLKTKSNYGCNSNPSSYRQYCTALIQMNGWKIPDDYPFKVSY